MIFVDTAPLVALCDPTDNLHARAVADLDRSRTRPLIVCESVLTEAVFLLPHQAQRARLGALARALGLQAWAPDEPDSFRDMVFAWLDQYAEHAPDWADATLVVASHARRKARVWTYDREFEATWRRPDGTAVPLFPKGPVHRRRRR